jgi:drug/metabolite transporter (DMT)-like permease
MTTRYELLINAINNSNDFITRMFLFALAAVLAWPVLEWTPHWMRRPVKYLYLASLLGMFIFATVFSAQ